MTVENLSKKETRWDLKKQVRELERKLKERDEELQQKSLEIQQGKTTMTLMHNCSHCRGHKIDN